MSWLGVSQSRPYVVTVRDRGGSETEYRVEAYDALEAMFVGSIKAGVDNVVDPTVTDVRPDTEALAEMLAEQRVNAMSTSVVRRLENLGLRRRDDEQEDEER